MISVGFKGVISGFAKVNVNESIDLNDIDLATAHKVSYASGVLTIKDGSGHTAQLHFSGTYTLASFNLNDDGHGGTLLTDPPAPTKPQNTSNNLANLFSQFMASWTNPITALASEVMHSPLASELQSAISLVHAHG